MNKIQSGIYCLAGALGVFSFGLTGYIQSVTIPAIDKQLAQEDAYVTDLERTIVTKTLVDGLTDLGTSSPSLQQRIEEIIPIISAYQEPVAALRNFQASTSLESQRETLLAAYYSLAETRGQSVSDRSAQLLAEERYHTFVPILSYGLAMCLLLVAPFFSSPVLGDKSYKQLPLFSFDERTKTYKSHEPRR